ncbi:MAG: TonB-dependent receptor [Capsulimonadaceae bacterium]|nr:TonB-dependent receptor [Capsulimonadaceae bacterium]
MMMTNSTSSYFLLVRIVVLLFVSLSIVCTVSTDAGAAGSFLATVVARTGELDVTHADTGQSSPEAEHALLYANDIVSTGATGRANLLFADGTQLFLNKQTSVSIVPSEATPKLRRVLFQLVRGEVFVRLRPNNIIATRAAMVAVRGTELALAVGSDDSTVVTVTTGSVDFFNEHGSVRVDAGQQSTASVGSAPRKPVTVQAGNLLFEWTLDVSQARIEREHVYVTADPALLAEQLKVRAAAANAGHPTGGAFLDYGDVLSDAHRYQDAFEAYKNAVNDASTSTQANIRLGFTLLRLDRLHDAQDAFTRAMPASPARLGLAWTALRENRYSDAVLFARGADGSVSNDLEATLVTGIALTRQFDTRASGRKILAGATLLSDPSLGHEALSWLALAESADGDFGLAFTHARAAVARAPRSPLAHGTLAIVSLCAGDTDAAYHEAKVASALDPDDVLSQVIESYGLLMANQPDRAARVAAKAAALEPELPEAEYILGLADVARNDYHHAEREFSATLDLAPSFTPAAAALAKLRARRGNVGGGKSLLQTMIGKHPDSADLHEALAEMLYDSHQYASSEKQYRIAARLEPDSALAHAGLARVLIDRKDLAEAIKEARKAVDLAPSVAQYHAILGLAYQYGFGTEGAADQQATREFRDALALDSRNSLARAELALLSLGSSSEDNGLQGTSAVNLSDIAQGSAIFAEEQRQRNAATSLANITQAILYDPSVARQLTPGGQSTEVSAETGKTHDEVFAQQSVSFLNGAGNAFAQYKNDLDKESGTDGRIETGVGYVAIQPSKDLTVLGSMIRQINDQSFPFQAMIGAPTTQLSTGDLANVAVGQRLGDNVSAWVGLSGLFTQDSYANPNGGIVWEVSNSRSVVPEVRIDINPNLNAKHSPRFSFGIASGPQTVHTASLEASFDPFFPSTPYQVGTTQAVQNVYANASWNVDSRLFFAGQIRSQRTTQQDITPQTHVDVLLPSAQVSYRAQRDLLLRVIAGRDALSTTLATLMPNDSLVAMEQDVLPIGNADQTESLEFDVERYFRAATVKVFGFETYSRDLLYGSQAPMSAYSTVNMADRVTRSGGGIRIDAPVARSLFASGYFVSSTTDSVWGQDPLIMATATHSYGYGTLPYSPHYNASFGLSYVDRATRVSCAVRYQGGLNIEAVTVDEFGDQFYTTQSFSSQTYIDASVRRKLLENLDLYFQGKNLMNAPELQFSTLQVPGRVFETGATLRF